MKIAVIGGGSTYTPELVSGLWRQRDRLPVDELWLMDPDLPRLEVVGGMARRMLAKQGSDVGVTLTGDRSAAIDGADAVLIQLRVGGQAARLRDETFPLQCDCVGQETTGAGGLAKALRTVPVVLDIADETARRAAPRAHLIDFTNPVGINTRALLGAGHAALGLCNSAIGVQRWIAEERGSTPGGSRWIRSASITSAGSGPSGSTGRTSSRASSSATGSGSAAAAAWRASSSASSACCPPTTCTTTTSTTPRSGR
ncbi:hypothetical protein GCM10025866_19840 [Naasia aerilata]|uniref:6-phospho-beta-glucosidase n=1 Tax=Naasia aerilata TaxID=1162966 RepID=A0ABM8GCV3_9MICO|nr:hypothetical protein GCM10025866_19840 [Naasia aerilata]